MALKTFLIKLHSIFCQFGIDPLRFTRSCGALPHYVRDWTVFRRGYLGKMTLMPCLHNRGEDAGVTTSEYFWQDLLVARWIYEARPTRHADVGSRIDGFVAHVASFREIELFDVRPISVMIPGIVFRQADLMAEVVTANIARIGRFDSLSCLHALEHFGLGRYGDPIDPTGYQRGIAHMADLLTAGGTFYLSIPLGKERVEFNANWVFDPRTIVRYALANGLALHGLTIVGGSSEPRTIEPTEEILKKLAESNYRLGIFVFKKLNVPDVS